MNDRLSKKKIDSSLKALTALLFANVSVIFILVAFTLNFGESTTTSSQTSSPNIVPQDNSNSLLSRKVIAWFGAGAFGYAAIYAIGKNIAEE